MAGGPPNLPEYRAQVDHVAGAIGQDRDESHWLALAAADPAVLSVLERHPLGAEKALEGLREEVAGFRVNGRSSAGSVVAMARIYLLHQIDASWWGSLSAFADSQSIATATSLVDLEHARRQGQLRFHFRRQPRHLGTRVLRSAQRRIGVQSAPPSAGLRYVRARPEMIALVNRVVDRYEARVGASSPAARAGVWVNSAVRCLDHQRHLRSLGYSALEPSSHCTGHAVDLAVDWLAASGGDRAIKDVLLEMQDEGLVNVIDEGTAWHVCVAPHAVDELRAEYAALAAS